MADEKVFEGWAILELMGYRRLGGYLTEQEIAGAAFLRIDVPSDPPATQFYSAAAVYAITPTTEEIARGLAAQCRPEPVHRFELPALREPGRCSEHEYWDESDADERDRQLEREQAEREAAEEDPELPF